MKFGDILLLFGMDSIDEVVGLYFASQEELARIGKIFQMHCRGANQGPMTSAWMQHSPVGPAVPSRVLLFPGLYLSSY